jgi:hypothetical protein
MNHQSVTVVTGPTQEPLSLAEAETHLRVTSDEEDGLILSLIKAARRQVETDTRRALLTQTLRLTLDRFPVGPLIDNHREPVWGTDPYHLSRYGMILVPRPPLQSVTSIVYTDSTEVRRRWSASDVHRGHGRSREGSRRPIVRVADGTVPQINAVTSHLRRGVDHGHHARHGEAPDEIVGRSFL